MKSYRGTFARMRDAQVLPVIKEVARTGVTQTIQVAKRNLKITQEVALFFIKRPIVHLGMLTGAVLAGSLHVSPIRGFLPCVTRWSQEFK